MIRFEYRISRQCAMDHMRRRSRFRIVRSRRQDAQYKCHLWFVKVLSLKARPTIFRCTSWQECVVALRGLSLGVWADDLSMQRDHCSASK